MTMVSGSQIPTPAALRPDLAIIAGNVERGSKVLDIGCGDGALMAALRATPTRAYSS